MAPNVLNDAPTAVMQARVRDAVAGQHVEPASSLATQPQPLVSSNDLRDDADARAASMNAWLAYRYHYYSWMQAQFQSHLMQNVASMQPWTSQSNFLVPPYPNVIPAFYGQEMPPNPVTANAHQVPVPAPPPNRPDFAAPNLPPHGANVALAGANGNNNPPLPAAANNNNNENGPQVMNVQGDAVNADWDGDIFDILFTAVKAVTVIMLLSYSPSAMRFAMLGGAFLVLRALRNRWNVGRRAPANGAPAAAHVQQPVVNQPVPAAGQNAVAAAAPNNNNADNNFNVLVDEDELPDDADYDDDASTDSDDEDRQPAAVPGTSPTPPTVPAGSAPPAPQSFTSRARLFAERSLQFVIGFLQSILPETPN